MRLLQSSALNHLYIIILYIHLYLMFVEKYLFYNIFYKVDDFHDILEFVKV